MLILSLSCEHEIAGFPCQQIVVRTQRRQPVQILFDSVMSILRDLDLIVGGEVFDGGSGLSVNILSNYADVAQVMLERIFVDPMVNEELIWRDLARVEVDGLTQARTWSSPVVRTSTVSTAPSSLMH